MYITPFIWRTMRKCALPNNLITKVLHSKNPIKNNLEIVTSRRITMEVEAPCRFQHAMQFYKTCGHHSKICHHLIGTYKAPQCRHHTGYFIRSMCDEMVVGMFSLWPPMPGILESNNLCFTIQSLLILEQDIIVAVRIEWRVKINEIHTFVNQVVA